MNTLLTSVRATDNEKAPDPGGWKVIKEARLLVGQGKNVFHIQYFVRHSLTSLVNKTSRENVTIQNKRIQGDMRLEKRNI